MTRPLMVRVRFINEGSRTTPHVTESMKIRYLEDDTCYRWTVYARKTESVESVLRRVGAQMVMEDHDNVLCSSCDPRGRFSHFKFHSTLKTIKCRGIRYEDSDPEAMAGLMADAIGNAVANSNDCIELTECFKWVMGPAAMIFARKYRPFPDNEPWFRRGVGPDLVVEPIDSLEPLVARLPSYDSSERINSSEQMKNTSPPGYDQIVSGKQDFGTMQNHHTRKTTPTLEPPKASYQDHCSLEDQIPKMSSEITLKEKVLAIDNDVGNRIMSQDDGLHGSRTATELMSNMAKTKIRPVSHVSKTRRPHRPHRPQVSIV